MNASPEGIHLYIFFHVGVLLCQLAGLVMFGTDCYKPCGIILHLRRGLWMLSLTFTTVCKAF